MPITEKPWKAVAQRGYYSGTYCIFIDAGPSRSARHFIDVHGPIDLSKEDPYEEVRANSLAVATVPELLEASKTFLDWFDSDVESPVGLAKVAIMTRIAVKKAEGEPIMERILPKKMTVSHRGYTIEITKSPDSMGNWNFYYYAYNPTTGDELDEGQYECTPPTEIDVINEVKSIIDGRVEAEEAKE